MGYERFLDGRETPEEEAAADARARAEIAAGRTISGEAVLRWLKAASKGRKLPRPQVGD